MVKKNTDTSLPAKLSPPKLHSHSRRPRLKKLLDAACVNSIVWVSGPAGAGKSALLADYVKTYDVKYIWFNLDNRDTDTATFFSCLRQAATSIDKKNAERLPLLTHHDYHDIIAFAQRFFIRLYTILEPRFVIVFDGYQNLSENSTLQTLLPEIFTTITAEGTVILLSRNMPSPAFARFQALHTMSVLDWQDLRLTQQETHGLAQQYFDTKLTQKQLSDINKQCDGWITGLVLLLEHAKTRTIASRPDKLTLPQVLLDYFANEVFDRLNLMTQEILLRLAFFPQITKTSLGHLIPHHDAEQTPLSQVLRNYFITQANHTVYELNPLFREFLIIRNHNILTSDQLKIRYAETAELLLQEGHIELSAELFIKAECWHKLLQLTMQHADTLFIENRQTTIKQWLYILPSDISNNHPWALYWLGQCHRDTAPDDAQDKFKRAFRLFSMQADFTGQLLSSCAILDTIHFKFSDFSRMDPWLDWIEQHAMKLTTILNSNIHAQVTISVLRALIYRRPTHRDITHWAEKALRIYEATADPKLGLRGYTYAALHSLFTGDISLGLTIRARSKSFIKSHAALPGMQKAWLWIEASIDWIRGNTSQSIQSINQGLALSHSNGIDRWDYILLSEGIYAALNEGNISIAEQYLHNLASFVDHGKPQIISHYEYLNGWFALLQRDFGRAKAHIETALKLATRTGVPLSEVIYHLALVQILITSEKTAAAIEQLSNVSVLVQKLEQPLCTCIAGLLSAELAFKLSNEDKGRTYLSNAFYLAREQGYMGMFSWDPELMTHLCMKALEYKIETDYAQKLIRLRKLHPSTSRITQSNWPWPIKIYTLGRFEVLVNDKILEHTHKKGQMKPLELLRLLIAFGGCSVSSARLAEILWPDSDGDAAYDALTKTIARLRKRLGKPDIIKVQAKSITLDEKYFWVDIWSLQHLLTSPPRNSQTVHQHMTNNWRQQIPLQATRILELYQGLFLPDSDGAWVLPVRDKLRNQFIRYINHTGFELENAELHKQAIHIYEQALVAEPLAESFYQDLIRNYIHIGNNSEAITTYQRCHKMLGLNLGIEPSPQTRDLYHKINPRPTLRKQLQQTETNS